MRRVCVVCACNHHTASTHPSTMCAESVRTDACMCRRSFMCMCVIDVCICAVRMCVCMCMCVCAGQHNGTYAFGVGELLYRIRLEFRENTGTSKLKMEWSAASAGVVRSVVPQQRLFSSATHINLSPFTVFIGLYSVFPVLCVCVCVCVHVCACVGGGSWTL